jgi:hypothetical protein
VPSLDLRFADNKSLTDAVTGASLVTFTRASSGTYVDSAGVIQTAATDVPRFDHNPTTGASLGLLVEEQRSNLLLNSATLSTQSVTVDAAANTLSFYGTGTVTLTGVSTAGPLVGTGANDRVSLTFTPIVGVLVLTVSGSVTNAQLETGAFPTSYIPTTAAAVTRSADVASITDSAFSSWYRQDEGTVFVIGSTKGVAASSAFIQFDDTTASERIGLRRTQTQDRLACIIVDGGATQANNSIVSPAFIDGATGRCALAFASNNVNISFNGALSTLDTTATIPTVTQATIGTGVGASYINNCISRITYWPVRLGDNVLQQVTQ